MPYAIRHKTLLSTVKDIGVFALVRLKQHYEQIVNTALIFFVNSLTSFYSGLNKDTGQPSGWTEKRLRLTFDCSGGLSWVAVTDGFLSKGGQAKAIVEVKPYMRSRILEPLQ